MAVPKTNNAIIKYKNGDKMSRISFEQDNLLVNDFKKILKKQGKSIASVLRPNVIKYIDENKDVL